MEFIFFISALFPPSRDMLTSALIVPSPRALPLYSRTLINSRRKVLASSGEVISGSVTISINGIPDLLKSTTPKSGLY